MNTRKHALALLACVAVVGCNGDPRPNESTPHATVYHAMDRIVPGIWTDAETGCQYLLVRVKEGNSVTPRLGSDGKPMCGAQGVGLGPEQSPGISEPTSVKDR